jgi:superfamily II DNA or RNA helicase
VATLDELLAGFASDRDRGIGFEELVTWFLSTEPVYAARLRRIWLWRNWPGRWGVDAGIDVVAEATDGGLWAIQAKAYGSRYAIKKRDVDTFLAEAGRPQFTYRLLVATTNRIGATALRTIEAQPNTGLLMRSDLEAAAVDWDGFASARAPRRPKPKKLRPDQREAVGDVVRGLGRIGRGQLIMACGTGKTLVSQRVAERLDASRTIVLVPSLGLLAQSLREWTTNAEASFEWLCVCSDETVPAGLDAPVEHTADLAVPVTTNPAEIAKFLRRRSRLVVFATYQSSQRVALAQTEPRVPPFDLAIGDEAHRCAGRVTSEFATVLGDDAIRARKRLFMTATPRTFTPGLQARARQAGVDIVSMDDETMFGPVLHRLSFAAAIDRDLLTDYRVVVAGVDDATILNMVRDGQIVATDDGLDTDARSLAAHVVVAKATRDFDLHRVITFHSRVARARQFATDHSRVTAWLPDDQRPSGHVHCDYVSGDMPTGMRSARLDALRHIENGERAILANARCLTEGIDVPTLDGVAFIDPRRSQVDIVQAVGRAIRRSDTKTTGTVIVPVFVSSAEDPEAALNGSDFAPVWSVLNALRSHDEMLGEAIDELRIQLGRTGRLGDLPSKIVIDLPTSVGEEFATALRLRIVERASREWEFWYGLLAGYVDREGHAAPPADHREHGLQLGRWVTGQRGYARRGLLDDERAARLAALPGWVWNTRDAAWDTAMAALKDYARTHGHTLVPHALVVGNIRLGRWVIQRRMDHTYGRLSEYEEAQLEALPRWTWDLKETKWERGLEALCSFVEREGHGRVPTGWVEAGYPLGVWCQNVRAFGRRGQLSRDRRTAIEKASPGWAWHTHEAAWEEGYRRLLEYVDDHGHAQVPAKYRLPDGYGLGVWTSKQRLAGGAGELDVERYLRLSGITGWSWDPLTERWDHAYGLLLQFANREGHAIVPDGHVEDGFPLGSWTWIQRSAYRRGELDVSRAERLDAVSGWIWELREQAWSNGYGALRAYVDRTGSAVVPFGHREHNYELGRWVHKQRTRRASLTDEQRAALEQLPGWSWDARSTRWDTGFKHLINYLEQHGTVRVPKDHVEAGYLLGSWVSVQRQRGRTGQLRPERRERLEGVPGWTW